MASTIAHLGQVSDSLDTVAQFFRIMADAGVLLPELVRPIDDLAARGNLVAFLKAGCPTFMLPDSTPSSPVVEQKLNPTIVELGELVVNCGEEITAKLAPITDSARIGWRTPWAADEKFPDVRTGTKRFKASAICFHQSMAQEAVEKWCAKNNKNLALPKDGIDLAKVSPRPKLDNVMPLAMAGQFFVGVYRRRRALYFDRDGAERFLNYAWLRPDGKWHGGWWFLVLEELPSAA